MCKPETNPLTNEDTIRLASLAGFCEIVRFKSSLEKFSLQKPISVGFTREISTESGKLSDSTWRLQRAVRQAISSNILMLRKATPDGSGKCAGRRDII